MRILRTLWAMGYGMQSDQESGRDPRVQTLGLVITQKPEANQAIGTV